LNDTGILWVIYWMQFYPRVGQSGVPNLHCNRFGRQRLLLFTQIPTVKMAVTAFGAGNATIRVRNTEVRPITLSRALAICVVVTFLSGCLQVELVGPVVGSKISIVPLRGGTPVVTGLITAGVEETVAVLTADVWDKLNSKTRLRVLGGVSVPTKNLKNRTYYLVTAKGGIDLDSDGDKRLDRQGREVVRDLHAIMTGAQIKNSARVTMLSEAVYQQVSPQVADLSNAELKKLLNDSAIRLVGDVDGNGKKGYADMLKWSNLQSSDRYKGPAVFLERFPRTFSDTTLDNSVSGWDSFNLVMGARWKPARKNSEYAADLVPCVSAIIYAETCTFGQFPLLGMQYASPTVDNIMDRVIVSHTWMAKRFEQVLLEVPAEMLLMFRSVTAIVIDADTTPSFYEPWAAAIFLDGDYFWQTKKERKHIADLDDFRSEFGSGMSFADYWRYVKDNDNATPTFYETDSNGHRSLKHVVEQSASLLFHELAHAADAFRPESLSGLKSWEIPFEDNQISVSTELSLSSPLRAYELYGIADVLYSGSTPNPAQASMTGAQVGSVFERDGASDLYAYYSHWEDTAMIFEEAMMALHYGFSRDIAFTSVPSSFEESSCADYRVEWGVRGRIAANAVLPRVKEVVSKILPERDYQNQLNALPKPVLMVISRDWCENLQLNRGTATSDARSERLLSAEKPAPKRNPRHFR
jgi:hypothetical protein